MRLFVAILLPEETKAALMERILVLRGISARGRFTRRENLHLTLAFLGETERETAARRAIERAEGEPFSLRVGGMGRFRRPGGDIPWAGVEPDRALLALQESLLAQLRAEGFSLERRPYRPHLTLGRAVRLPTGLEPEQMCSREIPAVPVGELYLMCSERVDGRLCYTERYRRVL